MDRSRDRFHLFGHHRSGLNARPGVEDFAMKRSERIAIGLVAAITWIGLIIQASVSFPGMLAKGLTLSDAFIRFFSYFTTLTNTFIAVDSVILFVKGESRWSKSLLHSSLETCLAVSILFVSAGFTILLSNLVHFTGTALLADNILHYAVPTAFLFYWCIFTSRHILPWGPCRLVAYFTRFCILATHWFKVGALDSTHILLLMSAELAMGQTLVNGTALLFLFWMGGLLFISLGRVLHRPRIADPSAAP